MPRRYLATPAIALLVLLAFPSPSHASIWDWIWTMSGPQPIGVVLHCEIDWEHRDPKEYDLAECRFVDYRFTRSAVALRTRRTSWLSLDTIGYTSTGKNSEDDASMEIDFKKFENNMVAFEPMIEIRSLTKKGGAFMLHHGLVGATYDVLFGSHFDTFDKIGLKFRPIGFTAWGWNGAFNVRWFPHGFTKDEFGIGPRQPDLDRHGEWTWGLSMGYLWGPKTLPRSERR